MAAPYPDACDETRRLLLASAFVDVCKKTRSHELMGTVMNALVFQHEMLDFIECFTLLERLAGDAPSVEDLALIDRLCDDLTDRAADGPVLAPEDDRPYDDEEVSDGR